MIGEISMIKEKHITTISKNCLNCMIIYQFRKRYKTPVMFFVKKPAGCVFPFQRSPLAKDYNRHAYQWLPAPLEALKLPGEFTLNDGHHFFYTNEVSKGDEIHIRWESQKCNPFLCFNFSRYASSSSSLQFAVFWERFRIFGRTHEVHPTAVHGSVSR